MQLWFNLLILFGAGTGVSLGALAHPKFYAFVFGGEPGSADHEPERCL